ncbi:GtrA family protein [Uliginosibacterium aquaticum]|uniref:GtrA family protein n=1 Tax=Uliginosibacterium aquaticum TaxID=2731212 RepID=A0ABX2IBH6_9RHOO|nr:GtrA family protein [Uliginosibacterium aquaticum]
MRYFSNTFFRDSAAYAFVSLLAYGLVFGLMYFFVDLVGIGEPAAFFFTYAIAYFFDYIMNLRVVFRREHAGHRLVKYIIYLVVFFILANAIFYIANNFNLHYLWGTFLTLAVLFPLRFCALRYVVFR